ncbi:hypothetical protein [Clostridium cadaveris]|uniref:hypothetical protein n=1 Tax=Clostridium cadaveris TaxID=1529 RepID=UPI003996301B
MENKNNTNNLGCGCLVIFLIVIILGVMGMFETCNDNSKKNTSYEKILENGQRKSITGEPMTRQEKDAMKSFNKWKQEEKAKKYSR